jgi:hypothetical protein
VAVTSKGEKEWGWGYRKGAYTLSGEELVPGLDLRKSGIPLSPATRGELDVDPTSVEFGLVQAQGGLQRGPR